MQSEHNGFPRCATASLATNSMRSEDKLPPVVLFTTPRDKAEDVASSEPIAIQFAPVMDKATIVDGRGVKITRSGDGASVKGSWSSSRGGARFTFTPEKQLAEGEQYKIIVSTRVKNEAGIPLDQARTAEFTIAEKTAE